MELPRTAAEWPAGFYFGKNSFYKQKKAPDGAFFDGRFFLHGKQFVWESAVATPQFSSKTTEFNDRSFYL